MIVIRLGKWLQQGYNNNKTNIIYSRIFAGKNKNIWTPFCWRKKDRKKVKRQTYFWRTLGDTSSRTHKYR